MDPRNLAEWDQAWAHMRDVYIPAIAEYYKCMLQYTGSTEAANVLTLQFQKALLEAGFGHERK